MNDKLYLVDENGEVIRELDRTAKIITGNQIRYLRDMEVVDIPFVKINSEAFLEINEYMKYIIILFKYMEYETNILKFSNGRAIVKNKNFSKVFGVGETMTKKILKYLKEEDIIKKVVGECEYYVVNPYLIQCSKKVPKTLSKMFKTSKWRYYSNEIEK